MRETNGLGPALRVALMMVALCACGPRRDGAASASAGAPRAHRIADGVAHAGPRAVSHHAGPRAVSHHAIASTVAGPKSVAERPPFRGVKLALIHTANLEGELEPCG